MSSESNDFRAFELDGWNTVSQGYKDHFERLTLQSVDALLDAAQVTSGKTVLDIATGPGHVAAIASRRGAETVGLDFSPAQVDLAEKTYAGVTFQQGDAEDLPFGGESFDAVVMNFGILHFPNPDVALKEVHRVLRPNGRFAATWWATPDKAVGLGAILGAIQKHGNPDVPLPPGPDFFSLSEHEAFREALREAGFSDPVDVTELPLYWLQETPEGIFDSVLKGGLRVRAVIKGQRPENVEAIKHEVASTLEQYKAQEGYKIPMTCLLAAADN